MIDCSNYVPSVAPCGAALNPAWRRGWQSTRPAGRVAELGSLAINMTLRSISDRYHAIARDLAAPAKPVRFVTTPQHDGSPHIECIGGGFHYVVTERGSEPERRMTSEAEELLFWLVSDLTWALASEWEVQHRIEGEDFRRQLFRKDVELMSQVSEDWARRKKEKYEKILGEYPFDDRMANQTVQRTGASRSAQETNGSRR